ncbi:hypothetical protein LBMAG42_19230 [Deltaproteobacteria bacterium]|nr:hypothetical protein LBMAG42_19230 [Deltaproteobacteria bacterium]
MENDAAALAALLERLNASPHAGAVRLEAAVLANRLALSTRDLTFADVAEAVAEEHAPGATRALREGLIEQSILAASIRRVVAAAAFNEPERRSAVAHARAGH